MQVRNLSVLSGLVTLRSASAQSASACSKDALTVELQMYFKWGACAVF